MAEDMSKRGLNPLASAFVPNINAKPFVPGQPVHQAVVTPDAPVQAVHQKPESTAPEIVSHSKGDAKKAPVEQVSWDENDESAASEADGLSLPSSGHEDDSVSSTAKTPKEVVTLPSVTQHAPPSEPVVKPKKKNTIPADANRKQHVNMVFIGHVDAGKSTIGGHLMYLTGMVDKRTLEKYEREAKEKGRESWYLSWALDTNDEEREKGKTVEVGRAYFETELKHFTILDAPGHKSFVPNMISGATQADLAVLVISARRGEFETGFDRGGQTREHAVLVKTTGVKHMVILVNKMDDPTVGWDEARFLEIQGKLTPFLRNKCGFNPKTDIVYIPCSGLTGAFLKERPDAQFASWYTGPCFIEYIDTLMPNINRDMEGPVRSIIADKYNDMGTVVIGKIESGTVNKGQNLLLMPNRTTIQVVQLWSDELETDRVVSGENVKLKLKGIEDTDILSGFILCSPEAPCHVGRVFDAEVVILEHKSIICAGYTCVLHIHAAVEEVTVKTLICTIDKKTGAKVKSRFVRQDEKCIMRLESAESFCLEAFKDFPQMGRFTLRDEGKTIAIGKVLKNLSRFANRIRQRLRHRLNVEFKQFKPSVYLSPPNGFVVGPKNKKRGPAGGGPSTSETPRRRPKAGGGGGGGVEEAVAVAPPAPIGTPTSSGLGQGPPIGPYAELSGVHPQQRMHLPPASSCPPSTMSPNGPPPPQTQYRFGGVPPPPQMHHGGSMPPPHIIPDQPGYRHMPPMMGPPAHHLPPMPQVPPQQLSLIETLIQLMNRRFFIFVNSGIAEKDHAQWWDAFAHEFFDDDAKMTFVIHDDANATQKYTIGRTLIPRYFRTVFDGGVKEMFYLIKSVVRELHGQWGPIFDAENVLLVTKHDKPVQAEVQTECKLVTEVAAEEGYGHRFRLWTIEMRHCQEYIVRDMNILQNAETQERLRSSLTRTGMTPPTINYLKMCIILEPMQILMAANKQFEGSSTKITPRQCLQNTLFEHHNRMMQQQQRQHQQQQAQQAQQQQQQQHMAAMGMGVAPTHLLPAPPIEEHVAPRATKARKRTRKGSTGNTPAANSKKKNVASPAPVAPNFPMNPQMYQDVMVVGEPSMMGGEYGEEDERTISRVVNTQYADGPHGMMGHGPGPPGGPGGPPHMHQMGGHPFMQVPFEMGGPGPGPGGWGGGPPPQPPPGSIIMPQRPGSTSSTPHTPVSRIGTPMGGMPGDLAGKNILNSVDGSSGGNGNISV